MMASAGAVLSGIMWLQQLHDHRWVAPVPYGPRPRSNAQPNRPSIDYATALGPRPGVGRRGLLAVEEAQQPPEAVHHLMGERTEELEGCFGLPQRRDVGTDHLAQRTAGRATEPGMVGCRAGADPAGEEGVQLGRQRRVERRQAGGKRV